jgi:hypothetical protein
MALVGWGRAFGTLARAYNLLGNHTRARALCLQALGHLSREDLAFPAMNLTVQVELAQAEAGLGNTAEAAQMVRGWLVEHGAGAGPLTLGALHEAGARIALLSGDDALFDEHFAAMEHAYRGTKIASLLERCERLSKKRARAIQPPLQPAQGQAHDLGAHLHTVLYRIRYGGSGSLLERARWALSQVSPYVRLTEGYVYLANDDGVQRIAALADDGARQDAVGPIRASLPADDLAGLDSWVRERMSARTNQQTMTAAVEDLQSLHKINEIELDDRHYRLIFLQTVQGMDEVVVGGLVVPVEVADSIPHTVLEAVASRFRTLSTHTDDVAGS